MAKKLLLPEDARASARRTYQLHHRSWLGGDGAWPCVIALGRPVERDVHDDASLVRAWIDAWSAFAEPAWIRWADVQWQRAGHQRVPTHLEIPAAQGLAAFVGENSRFERACERYARGAELWPSLAEAGVLSRAFDVFADYTDADFARLVRLVSWLSEHPDSGRALRELPVPGMHTKWIDAKRKTLITDWLSALRARPGAEGFHQICGLRPPLVRLRMRILCPSLRKATVGLSDVEAPLEDLAKLPLRPRRVFVIENLESGLALPDLSGCIALLGLGNAVSLVSRLEWAAGTEVVYWGDIDTHGFAILDRARASLGNVSSVLMDEQTLLACRELWVEEPVQCPVREFSHLTAAERSTFEGLCTQRWGHHVRLEQERIPWGRVVEALAES